MDQIPVLTLGDILLVSIQVDLEDQLALRLQEDLSDRIVSTGAHGVVIDISALDIVDSFIGRMLSTIASISRVLDAETVVVGMRPAVAITLVELGLSLKGVRTALTVEHGLRLLRGASSVELIGLRDADGSEEDGSEPARATSVPGGWGLRG
jgi:rsbT antagonist protein RsbS